MAPRRRSEVFRLGIGVVALATLVATLGRLNLAAADWWLIVSLAAAGILALEFPLHISLSVKVSVASAVFFAAVLLLPVWQSAALVGALQAADICVAAFRKIRRTRERPPRAVAINVLFNGGQAYLAGLLGALLLASDGVSARTGLARLPLAPPAGGDAPRRDARDGAHGGRGRPARPVHLQSLAAGRDLHARDRAQTWLQRERDRGARARGQGPRHRQDPHSRQHPSETERAHAWRAADHGDPPAPGLRDPAPVLGVREDPRPGAHPPRAVRRMRLPERERRPAPDDDRPGHPG